MDTALSGFKCSATEQIGDVILTQTILKCASVCASTDGCKSVFYTHSECVRCRSRYMKAGDARLLPMTESVSYRTGIVNDAIFYIVCIARFLSLIVLMGSPIAFVPLNLNMGRAQ